MKDLFMSCKVECPYVSRDSCITEWAGHQREIIIAIGAAFLTQLQQRLSQHLSRALYNNSRTNKAVVVQATPPFLSLQWIRTCGSGRVRCWYLPWVFSYSDSSGLQPRSADKTISPEERQALSIVLVEILIQEQWKLWLRKCIAILFWCAKHTGEPWEVPKRLSHCPFWHWRIFRRWESGDPH